jgi:hypothetical protein
MAKTVPVRELRANLSRPLDEVSDLLDLGWRLIDAIEDALGLLEGDPFAGHGLPVGCAVSGSLRVGV